MRPHPSISTDSNDQPRQTVPANPPQLEVKGAARFSMGFCAAVIILAWIVGWLYFGLRALRPLPYISSLSNAGLLIACVAGFTALYMVLGWKYLIRAIIAVCIILVLFALCFEARFIIALIVAGTYLIGGFILPFVGAAYLIFTLYTVMAIVIERVTKYKPARTPVSTYAIITLLMLAISAMTMGRLFPSPTPLGDSIRLNERIYVVAREVSGLFDAPGLGLYECDLLGFPCQRLWEERYDSLVPESDLRLSADGTAIELLLWYRLVFTYQPEPASPP